MDLNELKQKATELRLEGKTYKQISEHLDGALSVDWCKRNLKGVGKEKMSDACVEELVLKATRPEGVSIYEANAIIYKHNKGKRLSSDDTKKIRKKAMYADSNCLFRPAWIDATKPVESYKSLLAYVDHILDEIDYVTRQYCDTYPTVNYNAVRYEVMKYTFPKISPEPLSGRNMRFENIVEELASRRIESLKVEDEIVADTEDTLYTDTDLNIKEKDLGYIQLTEEELDSIWR